VRCGMKPIEPPRFVQIFTWAVAAILLLTPLASRAEPQNRNRAARALGELSDSLRELSAAISPSVVQITATGYGIGAVNNKAASVFSRDREARVPGSLSAPTGIWPNWTTWQARNPSCCRSSETAVWSSWCWKAIETRRLERSIRVWTNWNYWVCPSLHHRKERNTPRQLPLIPYWNFAIRRAAPVSSRMCMPVFARSTM